MAGHRYSLTERTQMTFGRFLLHGKPHLIKVASSMGMGARTRHRQLKAQGASFRETLDKLRRELAEQYLCGPEIGIISFSLHCSE